MSVTPSVGPDARSCTGRVAYRLWLAVIAKGHQETGVAAAVLARATMYEAGVTLALEIAVVLARAGVEPVDLDSANGPDALTAVVQTLPSRWALDASAGKKFSSQYDYQQHLRRSVTHHWRRVAQAVGYGDRTRQGRFA